MKNLWPSNLNIDTVRSSKSILEDQAKLLPSLTGELVYASVAPVETLEASLHSMKAEFCFKFLIQGKFLQKYTFTAFRFSHNITLYPVTIFLEEGLANELHIARNKYNQYLAEINNESEFEQFLKAIFYSERMRSVLSSIIQLSN